MYFEGLLCSIAEKDLPRRGKIFQKVCPYKKGAGRIAIRPAWTPILLVAVACNQVSLASLKRTGPYGLWHGGGQEPCGRWK